MTLLGMMVQEDGSGGWREGRYPGADRDDEPPEARGVGSPSRQVLEGLVPQVSRDAALPP